MDFPLSAEGEAQAARLAEALAGFELAAIWSSDLARARRTAEIIALAHPAARLVLTPDLREVGVGILSGLSWEEIEAAHPELARRIEAEGSWDSVPGAEPRERIRERIERIAREIERCRPDRAAAVGHGGTLPLLADRLAGRPLRLAFGNGRVVKLAGETRYVEVTSLP